MSTPTKPTTPAKAAPAKTTPATVNGGSAKPRKARTTVKPPAGFSFSGLSVRDSETPIRQRKSTVENPFRDAFKDSWDNRTRYSQDGGVSRYLGSPKEVTIPASAVRQAMNFVQYLADEMKLGRSVVVTDPADSSKVYNGPEEWDALGHKSVRFSFAAKTRKLKKDESE